MAKWEIIEDRKFKMQVGGKGRLKQPNSQNIIKVNKNGKIKEYDITSPEYKELYDSGKIFSYDEKTGDYVAPPLKEITVTAERPQWAKDKENIQNQYDKDWYINHEMPKFSRSMGISAMNMNPNDIKRYNSFINDKVVENIYLLYGVFFYNDSLKYALSLPIIQDEYKNRSSRLKLLIVLLMASNVSFH